LGVAVSLGRLYLAVIPHPSQRLFEVWRSDGIHGGACLAVCPSHDAAVAAARLLALGDPPLRVLA